MTAEEQVDAVPAVMMSRRVPGRVVALGVAMPPRTMGPAMFVPPGAVVVRGVALAVIAPRIAAVGTVCQRVARPAATEYQQAAQDQRRQFHGVSSTRGDPDLFDPEETLAGTD